MLLTLTPKTVSTIHGALWTWKYYLFSVIGLKHRYNMYQLPSSLSRRKTFPFMKEWNVWTNVGSLPWLRTFLTLWRMFSTVVNLQFSTIVNLHPALHVKVQDGKHWKLFQSCLPPRRNNLPIHGSSPFMGATIAM